MTALGPQPRWRAHCAALALVCAAAVSVPTAVHADQAGFKAQQGMMWARWKKCDKAIPLLEEAELLRHQAHVTLALADCYASTGRLTESVELYRALVDEKVTPRHLFQDRAAIKKAPKRLADAEARIPTVAFEVPAEYEGLEVFVNGQKVDDPTTPRPVAPDVTIVMVARAKGYDEMRDDFVLAEGERLVRPIRLTKTPVERRSRKKARARPAEKASDGVWFGMRGRGYVIPSFMWRAFGEGGRTVLAPGGALTLTTKTEDTDLMFSLGYASYGLKPTPFKARNAPETDWEIIESNLQAAYLTAELAWRSPLDDDGDWEFFWGGGVGLGWTFAGDILRTQAYPPNLRPGDPYTYNKCAGPNDPPGTYAYCNELDHDADHYEYAEPHWFVGGKRPLIYPWLAFPQLGLTYKPSHATALDLEVGLTTGGLLVGLGVRGR